MCGIVGAVAQQDVTPILLNGLQRLEYRGYDSAGLVVQMANGEQRRARQVGKVAALADYLADQPVNGATGIAHTRWATHGKPAEHNAHPHTSDPVAVVHNGIIENHHELRQELETQGYQFSSDTDTEVIAHLVASLLVQDVSLLTAVQQATERLVGAYALAIIASDAPGEMIAVRVGSPLVIGIGAEGHFVASDVSALLPVTQQFIYLEEGDTAQITRPQVKILSAQGQPVARAVHTSALNAAQVEKAGYDHYMQKEIFEQPAVVAETLEGRISQDRVLEDSFGCEIRSLLDQTDTIHIVACGTSYHAGLIAKYWLETIGVACQVEIASEYRYRTVVVPDKTLFLTISQSGETADTLAALRMAKQHSYLGSVVVCNVPESSLVRESDAVLMTRAGPEIGVASTKAFSTQLIVLRLLVLSLARRRGMHSTQEQQQVAALQALPRQIEEVLQQDARIAALATRFTAARSMLFLGRGPFYPTMMEAALKLKELSYIHAEAYPAGELKHGPLALVDEQMHIICAVPDNLLTDKVLSNLQEVRARNGRVCVLHDETVAPDLDDYAACVMPAADADLSLIVYSVALQLLAYHVAVLNGTNVDQPRNLAKSVTVE
ncbi:MAG: glutamine--fructose-6-phosphate transaminase (isomerizing) [Pseudomonadota bacterium]